MELILKNVQLICGSLIFLILLILLRRRNHSKLNEPPLVPYKYPIIGHTIDFYTDNENFVKKCQEKYGEIFSLYVFGRIITLVGKELSHELFKNHEEFSLSEATSDTFPMSEFMRRPDNFFDGFSKIIQGSLIGELKLYTERVQRQLVKSIDERIGDYKVLKPLLGSIQFIIAKPIAATLVGEELSDDEELVNSFAYATTDIVPFLSIPPILSFIHPILHKKFVVLLFKYLNNPFEVHRDIIKKKITPVIEERLSEMKELGDSYIRPTDLLQRFIEISHKDYIVDIDAVTDYVVGSVFASVHTTSRNLTLALYELASRPQIYKEILEEQEQIYKNSESSYYSNEQIAKMEKLDSFIKETLRLTADPVSLQHKTLSSYFTFPNGYQVPKGRVVYIRVKEIHTDEELQGRNPNEFNALRHLNKSPASRIEKRFVVFGSGKHACPGRYFAVNEIKIALHFLLLRYNIKKVNNVKIEPKAHGGSLSPSNEGLIFEKRL